MKKLHNVLDGMGILGEILTRPPTYPYFRNGFDKDRAALRQDMQQIVREMNQQIHKSYGK